MIYIRENESYEREGKRTTQESVVQCPVVLRRAVLSYSRTKTTAHVFLKNNTYHRYHTVAKKSAC